MLYQIILKLIVEEQIDQAYNWYQDHQTHLGEQFLEELDSYFETIRKSPAIFAKSEAGKFHQAFLKRFPYVIIYDIHNREIVLYSVFHTSRNPDHKIQ